MFRAAVVIGLIGGACAPPPTPPEPAPSSTTIGWQSRAIAYLDRRALAWLDHPIILTEIQHNGACSMSCHTTHAFAWARSALPGDDAVLDRVRGAIAAREAPLADWSNAAPMYGTRTDELGRRSIGAESVVDASALALGDAAAGRAPTPITRHALDLMWSAQRADGAWDWFEFGLEPWENGGDVGIGLAALTVASLPPDLRDARAARLAAYVQQRVTDVVRPMSLHDRALLLWASARWPELLPPSTRNEIAHALVEKQRPNGSWSLAGWGRGKLARADANSDAYASALATLALCDGALTHASAARGVSWLARSQRSDGSWPAASININGEPNNTFMTDAATAYAVLALARCKP